MPNPIAHHSILSSILKHTIYSHTILIKSLLLLLLSSLYYYQSSHPSFVGALLAWLVDCELDAADLKIIYPYKQFQILFGNEIPALIHVPETLDTWCVSSPSSIVVIQVSSLLLSYLITTTGITTTSSTKQEDKTNVDMGIIA